MCADMVNRGPYIYYTSNTVRTLENRYQASSNTVRTQTKKVPGPKQQHHEKPECVCMYF